MVIIGIHMYKKNQILVLQKKKIAKNGFRREALSRHMGIIGIKVYQLAVNAKETDSLGNLMKSPSIIFIPVYQDNFLSHSQSHCC
jgi:hypothetical protein